MNEVTNSRAEVEAMLRSVIQSSKGGVLISNLQKEYKLLVGKNVPFKSLGYSTMEAMLRDMPDIVRIVRNSSGEEVVNAVVDENTAHLASLVARQKSSKSVSKIKMPKRRPHRDPFGRKVQNSQYLPRVSHQNQNSYYNFNQTEYNSQNKNVSVTKQSSEHLHSSSLQKISTVRKPSRNLPPRLMRAHRIPSSPPAVLPSESFKELSEPVVTVPNNWMPTDSLQPIISDELVSNRDIIESYAIAKGIKATFRNIPLNKRELPFTYISTLMIDGQKFNSYPNDKPTEEEAEEEASRVAVEALDLRPGQESQNLKICSVNSFEEMKIMLDRIYQDNFVENKESDENKEDKTNEISADTYNIQNTELPNHSKNEEILEKMRRKQTVYLQNKTNIDGDCIEPIIEEEKNKLKDEYAAFGEIVAHKLRKLSTDYERNIVQFKIHELLLNAAMGYFRPTNYHNNNNISLEIPHYAPTVSPGFDSYKETVEMNELSSYSSDSNSISNPNISQILTSYSSQTNEDLFESCSSETNLEAL